MFATYKKHDIFKRRVWRYILSHLARGNQNPYIEEEQTTQSCTREMYYKDYRDAMFWQRRGNIYSYIVVMHG
jgi:hypothetical protein